MKPFRLFAAAFLALAYSSWLANAEMHTDDTGILVGLIGIGGCFLSMFEPQRPWIWGLLVPAGIILVNVWRHPSGVGGWFPIAAVTIAIGCAGSYAGAFIRRHVSFD